MGLNTIPSPFGGRGYYNPPIRVEPLRSGPEGPLATVQAYTTESTYTTGQAYTTVQSYSTGQAYTTESTYTAVQAYITEQTHMCTFEHLNN